MKETEYDAISETGAVKRFKSQGEVLTHFEIGYKELKRILAEGTEVVDPDTLEVYRITKCMKEEETSGCVAEQPC